MTAVEFIKEELKKQIKQKENWLKERIKTEDFACALKAKAEIDGLMSAWQIVCNSEDFEKQ